MVTIGAIWLWLTSHSTFYLHFIETEANLNKQQYTPNGTQYQKSTYPEALSHVQTTRILGVKLADRPQDSHCAFHLLYGSLDLQASQRSW